MTYIIAGKLKDRTFLMSDCVVTNVSTNKKTFTYKTIKLDSSPTTYYSFTGVEFIDLCVKYYDFWLIKKNRSNDFISGLNSIRELKCIIERMLLFFPGKEEMDLDINRLFFLDHENVVYYDLKFNDNNEFTSEPEKKTLDEGYYVNSAVDRDQQEIDLNAELEDYCKDKLRYLSRGNVDFKDRFTYIQLLTNGEVKINEPFKTFSDIIAMIDGVDYDILDDTDFVWDI